MTTWGRNSTIDVFRCLASYTVILIHTNFGLYPADYYFYHSKPLHYFFMTIYEVVQSMHIAVPFFFIVAGYFFGKTLQKGEPVGQVWKRYAKRLLRLFIVWSLVYYLIPLDWLDQVLRYGFLKTFYWNLLELPHTLLKEIAHPLQTFFHGPAPHLWFLTGLLTGLTILSVLIAIKQEKYALTLGAVLYIISVLATEYAQLPFLGGIQNTIISRHGAYVSVLFVSIGWWLANQKTYSSRTAWLVFIGGFVLMVAEGLFISSTKGWTKIYDYIFSFAPFTTGMFVIALVYPHFEENTVLPEWGKLNLGIYLIHMLVMGTLMTFKVFFYTSPILWMAIHPIAVFLLSIYLTKLLDSHAITRRIFL